VLQVDAVIAAAGLGAIAGDNIGYLLGARLGREWLLKRGSRIGVRTGRLEKAEAFFRRHGPKAVFFGRFIGFARALVPFVAGASRMPWRKYVVYDALGAIPWTVAFVTLGYVLGASWRVAEKWVSRSGLIVGGVVLAAALIVWLRRRKARPVREQA